MEQVAYRMITSKGTQSRAVWIDGTPSNMAVHRAHPLAEDIPSKVVIAPKEARRFFALQNGKPNGKTREKTIQHAEALVKKVLDGQGNGASRMLVEAVAKEIYFDCVLTGPTQANAGVHQFDLEGKMKNRALQAIASLGRSLFSLRNESATYAAILQKEIVEVAAKLRPLIPEEEKP